MRRGLGLVEPLGVPHHAADPGHVDVKQHDVKGRGAQGLKGLFSARCLGDLEAKPHESWLEGAADGGLVIDQQDANWGSVAHCFLLCAGIAA